VCALILALTLPAESLLLKALASQTTDDAIQSWASSLDSASLASDVQQIQAYPFKYRQALMRALPSDQRAAVWQRHIDKYLASHSELDATSVGLLQSARAVLTPDVLTKPTPEARQSLHAIAEQLVTLIGRDETRYVLHDLGPRDVKFASAEPWTLKLANYVRDNFVAMARSSSCDCAMSFGCYSYSGVCSTAQYCVWDGWWPACGWGWMDPCDGLCGNGT
jgi:hypothetical protein